MIYKELFCQAEKDDNPFAIYEIAKLYDCGAIPSDGEEFIEWLNRFFENPYVKAALYDLDDTDDLDNREKELLLPLLEEDPLLSLRLCPLIIDAGISLGLYYRYSFDLEELRCALAGLDSAWMARKYEDLEIEDSTDSVWLLSLIREITDRAELLGESQ